VFLIISSKKIQRSISHYFSNTWPIAIMPWIFQNCNIFYRWFHYAQFYTITMAVFSKFLPLKGFVVNDSKQNSELRAPKMWRSSFPFGQETLKFCLPGASLSWLFYLVGRQLAWASCPMGKWPRESYLLYLHQTNGQPFFSPGTISEWSNCNSGI